MTDFLVLLRDAPVIIGDKFAKLPLSLKYLAIALIVCAIAGLYIRKYALREDLVTRQIAGYDDNNLEALWFSPSGDLIAIKSSPKRTRYFEFDVLVWGPDGSGPVRSEFHGEAIIERWTYASDPQDSTDPRTNERLNLKSLSPLDLAGRSDGEANSKVAISRDGQRVAFLYMGNLIVAHPEGPIVWPDTLQLEGVSGLAFTDSAMIAVAYTDGKIEFRDRQYSIVGSALTKLNTPTIMKPFGNFLAVVSAINAGVVVLDMRALTKDAPPHGYPPTSLDRFTLAVSDTGRLGVSTGSHMIFLTQPDGTGDVSIQLEAPRPVVALSFYNNNSLLVGGYGNIYLLTEGESTRYVASPSEYIHHIVSNEDAIAYVDEKGVVLLSYNTIRVLRTSGKIAIAITAYVLLGLLGLYLYDLKTTRGKKAVPIEKPASSAFLSLPKELPPDLIEAATLGECVLYAGAGLGAQSGLPMWKDFVHLLLAWAADRKIIRDDEVNVYAAEIDIGYTDQVADSIISRVGTGDELVHLNAFIRKTFSRSVTPSAVHNLLGKISFSAVLTANFDDLLEHALPIYSKQIYTPNDAEALLGALTTRAHFILKLYGTLQRPETVIVAPAQYENAVAGNRLFSQFMQTLFVSRTLLFIGSSLEGIEAYLKGISLPKEIGRKHYALVAVDGNTWRAKADFLDRRYGIKVLPYTPTQNFPQPKEFLEMLVARVEQHPVRHVEVKTARSRLKRLSLENIGPFDSLNLEFDPDMQILLGDNGVGKSTILKAMAIALCGEEGRPYADRLLKAGKLSGSIILETDNKTNYVTNIVRNPSTGEVEMISNTARPLEAEGWLALGFPPLRTTSWTPLKGPDTDFKIKSRPVSDDLLPLVKGDVDPRIDKLKQWIVNLDYLSIKGSTDDSSADGRYRMLVEKLFAVIASVMEGIELKYVGVQAKTNRVLLQTPDGNNVPLEGLSQGTISLIGWIGILMQRLYEVFDQDEDPTQRYALVLMDEIDAHLHPLWQRTLVGHLKKVFPNAQFIATTHSPLVIGGMPATQVSRFGRDENGKLEVLLVPPDATFGYTDQLLTSMLFGLRTTLDQTTQEKMALYYRLYEMKDHGGRHEEFEQLKQELMVRVPPQSDSYQQKHDEQMSMAEMLHDLGNKLEQVSPRSGDVLLKRADNLKKNLTGGTEV